MNRASIVALVALALAGCKVADLDHCLHRGEHVWCAANEPERPLCSPCEPVADHFGCVAEQPPENACREFEPPATGSESSSSSSESSGTTGDTDTSTTG